VIIFSSATNLFNVTNKLAENIKTIQDEHIKLAIVTANNRYAGFGPGTANVFRNMLGLPEAKGGIREETNYKKLALRMTWT
jgi:hypothetical protein